ncbi:MAG: hypothetical protein ABSA47_16150 [Verrucomicrobiota bacterium]
MEALQFYRAKSTDFGDAFLCAFARSEGCVVATFDKGTVKEFTDFGGWQGATKENIPRGSSTEEQRRQPPKGPVSL